jgi:L-cystine uptake protein TcyP (sodium:dicarboxylate symporter family)
MKLHIFSEVLAILGIVSEFYAAGIGDGGGSWAAMIGFSVLGVALMLIAYLIEYKN